MDKKISVVVPVYNTEKYLEKCIDSILKQTYKNLQIILVDDGSTDSSPAICDSYAKKDDRITVIHKVNGGLSSARNAGIDAAEGDFIGFIDSDDFISSEMFELLIEHSTDSGKDLANVMYVRTFDDGTQAPSKVTHTKDEVFSASELTRELMLHTGDVSVCTKLFPKELFNGLRFPEGKCNEDLLFMIELLNRVENINFVGHIGYYYYTRSGSISNGYGKSVEDMVGNSVTVMDAVVKSHPELRIEAERFALYQHMAYLLLLPVEIASKDNAVYIGAITFIRKYTFKNLRNPYLNTKNKVILAAFCVAPKFFVKFFKNLKK